MKKNLYFTLLSCFWALYSFGQQEPKIEIGQRTLSKAELADFQKSAKRKVQSLQDNLTILAKKANPKEKPYYKEETLKLFINDGDSVTMEFSYLNNGKETRGRRPMTKYLEGLIGLKYTQVEITFADTWYISNFYQTGENSYEAVATIFQRFVGYGKDRRIAYTDITKKTVRVILEKVKDEFGERWGVLLGDISVVKTTKP